MYVLSREEMYTFDKYTIEKIGIPGKKLMENAGRGCAEFIRNELLVYPKDEKETLKESSKENIEEETFSRFKIALFCGAGNNGGDGFVIARYLKKWNFYPEIFLLGNEDKMSPETLENFQDCQKLRIPIQKIEDAEFELTDFDLIVDAIFGVGLKGTVRGWRAEVITKINATNLPVVAIDIASGIDADTGQAEIAVEADFTLTMANYKYGHFLEKGREKSGETLVVDIGIPEPVYEKFPPKAKLITTENVVYPLRSRFSHKGNYGRIGIIAGSPGFSGAAVMACRSALRSGAGIITLFHPAGMELIFESQLLEVMTYSIPADNDDLEKIAEFQKKLNSMDVLLIGPGIGVTNKARQLLEEILKTWHKPLVLDADSLNILSQNRDLVDLIKSKQIILTPHIGEFARLCQKTIPEIQADPLRCLEEFVKEYKCHILLKSSTTIFADKSGFVFDISGNDGLSTGGSGDVLAGIIVSFLGQKLDLRNSAISASYLLGETSEKLAEIRNPASIIPSDIIENLFKIT
ncbi:MAG: NAD(P)H-hydrate dehydratase [Candidatus Cloacimonetes bacterium]|nr:NAD(P)H-hydrate dehydratase [Candidatus Cloacimonadota bacterium]MCF7813979.1 NAD(P)H-hydrate dehydratase [Candidatus Cloacimonadota bacterium]MCF7868823.1 NAD(P)H-hydrate dehydratase [Candidatus Cloacimonadota bacterium]MCF7884082.1 NAD(P)H-hydrate dehydratase [Candidatus Cloacimonadota bacterium]